MKLIFERNSPLNTTLVDEATGEVVYEIETSGLLSRATIIWIPTRSEFFFGLFVDISFA